MAYSKSDARAHCQRPSSARGPLVAALCLVSLVTFASCERTSGEAKAPAESSDPAVAVSKIQRKAMARSLTISSELVPFQQIDVFAKESGYVSKLFVDYGSRVKKGQLLATLEIPELQAQLQEDEAAITSASDQVTNAKHQLSRIEAQHTVAHLQYDRLNGVAKSKPGLVAQQEVDDAQGRDLAAEAQVEGAKSNLAMAESQMAVAKSKLTHDQALYSYSQITAPFDGVVTRRDANLGTLVAAGTNSATQAMPVVQLSEEDIYRLVIPVPESYVGYVKLGDPVDIRVPSLDRTFLGKVSRFSIDVNDSTRTMHTEVDVPNPKRVLIPGVYAEATLNLDTRQDALVVPLQALNQSGKTATVLIVDGSNHIEQRNLTLGVQTENEAEVLSGLQLGDQVVISDRSGLRPGETVRPKVTDAATYQSES